MIDQKRKEGGGSTTTRASDEDIPYELGKELVELQHDAKLLLESLTRTGDDLARLVEVQVKQRPHLTLGIAAGVGYVLGGGLPNFVGKAAVRLGVRAAVSYAVGRIIQSVAGEPEA
jgi:hypothetical protein